MAPNRKNVAGLVQALSNSDLQSLQTTVEPKFLPLTHPNEESKHLQPQQQTSEKQQPQPPASEAASYWDWPADVKDVPVDLFSVAHIEANLIKDAKATASSESNKVASNDDYWAESTEPVESDVVEQVKPAQAQHTIVTAHASYWEWPADQDVKQATIRRILADDAARQRLSVASIEATERAAATAAVPSRKVQPTKESNDQYWQWNSNKVAPHVMDPSHPNANYWDWDDAAPQKPSAIQAILEYEAARELLSASSIVKQLQSAAPVSSSGGTKASSDDYWTMKEQYGDEYWQAPASTPVAATGKGYWDW